LWAAKSVFALWQSQQWSMKMPDYYDPNAPLSDTELGVASALNRMAARTYGPENRVYWFETVRVTADTLFDRPRWEDQLTLSMRKWLNFTDLCGYLNPNFGDTIK
jgi:hypothetical protein